MNLLPAHLALLWTGLILVAASAPAAVVTANFTSPTTIPVTAASYTATGNTVDITLGFAPPVGTNLTVVNNTGLAFIQGTFDKLQQGQSVSLTYAGTTYPFVANYFGGTGNDLVLQWANIHLVAWGYNAEGQLGNNGMSNSSVAVPVDMTGVLAGKSVIAITAGYSHNLALSSDGSLASWGDNGYGQLGNNSTATQSNVPVLVDTSGVLGGKSVIALAASHSHSLALCSDGTMASWGFNSYGQLGINSTTMQSNVPVLVYQKGALAGKSVIAIAAGEDHSLALCADGTLAAWGDNGYGQLGNNSTTQSNAPVLVNQTGVLAGKTVVAVATGIFHCLALCADGTMASWGNDSYGQLGDNGTTTQSYVPVLVDTSGVLGGKQVLAVAAALYHNLALCADGTVAAWGNNSAGQFGNNSTTSSRVAVLVDTSGLGTAERLVALDGGWYHSLAMVASAPPPVAVTLAATGITDTGATLNGGTDANGNSATISFEWGLGTAYGSIVAATPKTVQAANSAPVSAALDGLLSGATYHYRIVAESVCGVTKGADLTFTTSTFASLSGLALSAGTLSPEFVPALTRYAVTVPFVTERLNVTPVTAYPGAALTVNGSVVASGNSSPLELTEGDNPIVVVVTSADGNNIESYTVTVTRVPQTLRYSAVGQVGMTVTNLVASGSTANFELAFAPPVGTSLTVVNNTGPDVIQGQFSNLAQGQLVVLDYAGITYLFVANYFAGTGNDLVLQWANTRVFAWGDNSSGQVGNNSTVNAPIPVPVDRSGVLANKAVVAVAGRSGYQAALCSDGTVATWGANWSGELGNNSMSVSSPTPVAVCQTGILANKSVVALATGAAHLLALCADGSLAAWGDNSSGQLGNNDTNNSKVPVAVNLTGVLANKRVIAVAAGDSSSLALCSDGTLAAWGFNYYGQLGNNSNLDSWVPVLVDASGVLAGKRVTAIAAGSNHCLAVCADGTIAAWGSNRSGQLGNNSTNNARVPVAVVSSGLLSGKSVIASAGGEYHSIALCSDGTVAAWGINQYGMLGDGSTTNSSVPVAVDRSGVLADKTVRTVTADGFDSFAWCADGTLSAWGSDFQDNSGSSTTQSNVPVAVNTSNLAAGERFIAPANRLSGLVATPPGDLTPSIADGSSVIGTNPALAWSSDPFASSYHIYFGTDREAVAIATDASLQFVGSSPTPAWSANLPAFAPDGSYFWRIDTIYATGKRLGKVWSFRIAPVEMASVVNFAAVMGMSAAVVETPITSLLPATQTWAASLPGAPAWLSLVAASGSTPGSLKLRIDPAVVPAGSYSEMVRIIAGAAAFDVLVEFRLAALNVTKLISHPARQVVYGINAASADEGFGRLLEIDAATGSILRSLPIGTNPTDAALDPANERIHVSNWGAARSQVVDVAAWVQLPPLALGTDAYHVEVTPHGRVVTEGYDQWVDMTLWNAATGATLASAREIRAGDGQADPSGDFYYHCDSNSSAAVITKYNIANDSFLIAATSPVVDDYSTRNLILSGDGTRLFWQQRSWDADLHALARMPAEVYATNRSGELAIGAGLIWWSDSGTQAAALSFSSTVAAVSANDTYLLRFNPTTQTIQSTPLAGVSELPGPWPRPGQELAASPPRLSWPPVAGANVYRVFIAPDSATLQAMVTPVATVSNTYYDLPSPLDSGGLYCWRIDAVTGGGITPGNVEPFAIRFEEGPALPPSATGGTGYAVSIADGNLLVGNYSSAQLYDFNPTTGAAAVRRNFASLPNIATTVAMDTAKAAIGAYGYDTPLADCGAAYVFRPVDAGYWDSSGALSLATPVTGEAFGSGLAASGNLMLVGTSSTSSKIGRVAAYVTEPLTVWVQTFSAADAMPGDGFGCVIGVDGNQAIIAAPGRGRPSTRVGCLYAFSRSTTTGMWTQTQKIAIPGATTAGGSGKALALAGNTLATISDSGSVVIYTKDASGQWAQSASISRSNLPNSSPSFGCALALLGDRLFIGDSAATYALGGTGAVFGFRRGEAGWISSTTITPTVTPVSDRFVAFGSALAARDSWLLAAGGSAQSAWLFRVDPAANQTPRFMPGIPSQVVTGRAFSTLIRAEDDDGNSGLVIDMLENPAWLILTDGGNGNAVLSGTATGESADVCEVQLRVRDSAGAQAFYAIRLTVLAPTDVPNLTAEPLDTDNYEGREVILRAAASGIGPLHWQWYRDGIPISGATRSTLAFDEIALGDAGRYTVRVANVVGEDISATATVTVHEASRNAGDWPTFGASPAHNGRYPASLDSCSFIPVWNQTAQSGFELNRAVISNGRAFVVPKASGTGVSAKAFDLASGTQVWSYPLPASHSSNPPTVYNGRVYFQLGQGNLDATPKLLCLNADTGAKIWSTAFISQWNSFEAPAVTTQGIFINGGGYGGMYGFDFNGSQRFFQSLPQYDEWTPTLSNGHLFSSVAGLFQEHNPVDGVPIWSVAAGWHWNGWSMNTVAAVAGDSAMVFNNTEVVCIDLPSRSIRWRKTGSFSGSLAIGSGRTYVIQGTSVRSYAVADGAPGPVFQTTGTVGGLIEQPMVFNDRLLISNPAKTWIFNLASGQLLQTLNSGGRLSYSNGYLLAAGSDGVLRAFIAQSNNAKLAALSLDSGTLEPDFQAPVTSYIVTVPYTAREIRVSPASDFAGALVKVNGTAVASGTASAPISLAVGNTTITTVVTAEDGISSKTYTITVTRLPQEFVFHSATDAPVTANGFAAGDSPVSVILSYAPTSGTILTMVNNTGLGFIHGTFVNLAQGQRITLTFNGVPYDFVVNYYGGTGNDMVLQWADTQVAGWGSNSYGQLGETTTTRRLLPTPADTTGVLAGKTIVAIAEGYLHSLALCSDGTLAAWGYNVYGQLGNNNSAPSSVPVAVDRSGVLAGRTVVAISAGPFHNLALCSDGTVLAWGYNNYGQLGTGDTTTSRVPVLVNPTGALTGKQVVTVAAGAYHSFALCADGTLAGWGFNDDGELGNGSTNASSIPLAADASGALAGKQIGSLSAGQYHTLALCTDGTLVAWGYNNRGQLGNNSTLSSKVPVGIGSYGSLVGRSVASIRAGGSHSLALCADGTLSAWGWNNSDQLGASGIPQSHIPVLIDMTGVAAGTTLAQIAVGGNHSLALCANGTLAAWGDNASGQLGNSSLTQSAVPVGVDLSGLPVGARCMMLASGSAAQHNLAVFGRPPGSTPHAASGQSLAFGATGQSAASALIGRAFEVDATGGGALPQGRLVGNSFVISFKEPAGVSGFTYGAEWSETLEPGSWTEVADTGISPQHTFSLPIDARTKQYMRLKVTIP